MTYNGKSTAKSARPSGGSVQGRQSRFSALTGSVPRDTGPEWCLVDKNNLMWAVAACQAAGYALLFGATSDGGALTIVLFEGAEKHKFYAKSATEATELLRKIGDLAAEELPQEVRDRIISEAVL
jgi:hypothetical protein